MKIQLLVVIKDIYWTKQEQFSRILALKYTSLAALLDHVFLYHFLSSDGVLESYCGQFRVVMDLPY